MDTQYITAQPVGRSFLLQYLQTLVHENTIHSINHKNSKTNTNKKSKIKKKHKKPSKTNKITVEIEWDCDLSDYYSLLGIKKYGLHITHENIKKACMKPKNTQKTNNKQYKIQTEKCPCSATQIKHLHTKENMQKIDIK